MARPRSLLDITACRRARSERRAKNPEDPAAEGSSLKKRPRLESDGHSLGGQIVFKNRLAHLAAPARLLVAAKRQRRIEDVVAVDPHRAGLEARSQLMGLAHVARPDAGGQTIDRIVSLVDQGVVRLGER